MGEVNLVAQIFQKLDLKDLLKCKDILDSVINREFIKHEENIKSKHPSEFVEYEECFIDAKSVEYAAVEAEVEVLKLKQKSSSPATKWLTHTGQNYSWTSSTGHVTVKEADDINQFPAINQIMKDINSKYDLHLNGCLVSNYPNGDVFTTLHDDAEETMDQTQPIAVVSFGVTRTVDFIHQGASSRSRPLHSVNPADGSIYMMKPGCQTYFLHRVRRNYGEKKRRFCLSFRRIIPETEVISSNNPPQISSPVKALISKFESGNSELNTEDLSKEFSAPKNFTNPPKKKRTTVLFGTSITKYIDSNKLTERGHGRKFVNFSQNGAKIKHISENVDYFYKTHKSAYDVEKIIISLGTNDVKFSRRGVQHLKRYLIDLINKVKLLFPGSIIIFQCCLPIRNLYWYTVPNVVDFNSLLSSLCREYNCIYLDCFKDFLTVDMEYQAPYLFRDWLHLNADGLGILGGWFKYIVNQDSFNSVVNRAMN